MGRQLLELANTLAGDKIRNVNPGASDIPLFRG